MWHYLYRPVYARADARTNWAPCSLFICILVIGPLFYGCVVIVAQRITQEFDLDVTREVRVVPARACVRSVWTTYVAKTDNGGYLDIRSVVESQAWDRSLGVSFTLSQVTKIEYDASREGSRASTDPGSGSVESVSSNNTGYSERILCATLLLSKSIY